MLASILSGEFLLHIPCSLCFYVGSFSYTSHAGFTFIWGVSLTHPMLASFYNLGRFSYTSHAAFIFLQGVCLRHPVLLSLLCGKFLLHIPSWLMFSCLTHPVLTFFAWGGFSSTVYSAENPLRKKPGWKLAQEKSVKRSHSSQRRKP